MPSDWRWRHLTEQAAAGTVPSQRPELLAGDSKRSVLLHFPPSDDQQLATAFSVAAASHTRDTLPLAGYCTAWRKPSRRTLNFNFITGNEGHAAPYTCTEVRSGKTIMPCNAARMKELAMSKTNKPDLLLRPMLHFNNVTLAAACTCTGFGSAIWWTMG